MFIVTRTAGGSPRQGCYARSGHCLSLECEPLGRYWSASNHVVVEAKAQGLVRSTTLGIGVAAMILPTPKGLWRRSRSRQIRWGPCGRARLGHNSVGVADLAHGLSQGSRVQQPWAGGQIPFADIQLSASPNNRGAVRCADLSDSDMIRARRWTLPVVTGLSYPSIAYPEP